MSSLPDPLSGPDADNRFPDAQSGPDPASEDGIPSGEATPAPDRTGFVPFESDTYTDPARASDPTGFIPLQPEPGSPVEKSPAASPPPRSTAGGPTPAPSPRPHAVRPSSAANRAAAPRQSPPPPPAAVPGYQPVWRQAERARQWTALNRLDWAPLLLAQVATAIALFWGLQTLFYTIAYQTVKFLTWLPVLTIRLPLPALPVWSLLVPLVLLFVASRWLLDALLRSLEGLRPLTLEQLASYSPEAVRSLSRYCRTRQIPQPDLGLLPTRIPLAMSYGCLPRFTRLVVSQGLLEQLADDEIATVIASEVGHIACRDVPLTSLVVLILQIPYTLYRELADWGDRQSGRLPLEVASVLASLSYGFYWLLRWLGLWLSRQRSIYSDRIATDLTGNPNGLARALLKIAIGTAKQGQQQGQTAYLLESFDLLLPVGHQQATPLGSVYPYTPLEPLLEWGRRNPYRHWLVVNNSHLPLGDRLERLMQTARQWRLQPELEFPPSSSPPYLTRTQWQTLGLQGAPYFGFALGLALAGGFSLVGWVGLKFRLASLGWMYADPALIRSFPLIGLSLGTFIRLNPFFPEFQIGPSAQPPGPQPLPVLLANSSALPLQSQPVQLSGRLLGRPGVANRLNQDLWLSTQTGMIRLHCTSALGPLGDWLDASPHPIGLKNQELVATGWFRQGATPWIDVENLRTPSGRIIRSFHPSWSAIAAALATLWGLLILLRLG